MKILIIDDSADFRTLIKLYLTKQLPDTEVVEYDPELLGRPPDDYDWSGYEVLLLDYRLGPKEDGLEWLKAFGQKPHFPPTIVLTAEGDEYIAVKAIKLGAVDYINKADISPKRIAEMVEDAAGLNQPLPVISGHDINDYTQGNRHVHNRDKVPGRRQDIGYRFVRLIGEGAMSQVYLAERERDKKTVVIKILYINKVQKTNMFERFIQEAELISSLDSPFVVKIYDYGSTDDYGFIAMEFFSRGDLKHRMEAGIHPNMAIIYATHTAYALDQIHSIGIVHRDLKPANIMFRGDDSLALADFGISKKLNVNSDITTIGQVLGTPSYISPEQAEGQPVDTRSDIYSAGVLLYELLVGEKPFSANNPSALIYQHIHFPIPRLPSELHQYQKIIDRAMAKNPDDRFQSAAELIQVLEDAEKGIF
jgi:CheY-like chemotaxis protein/tRNA A-37 threonylcarbamoyl transferase component Bud32